ncbi:DUF302 domain-containing protein [Actinomadura sp. HBU206391]|uniref:DUF302 domain-containing protein n=1 Tax=Actinomadura sp. HBU206391 TaxID=2731692 RepID=UPI0016506629|nr:DUF302 domain-containing protein [Actinomadura sp. HBU206391]MBC6461518.1 DUF302 domain-containing protein [Actinomadura sp. HBU206391]
MDEHRTTCETYRSVRFTVEAGTPFDDFRADYEQSVPDYPAERFGELVARDAGWQEVLDLAWESAPHDFMIYWRYEAYPMMRLAGDRFRCVEYLMGNHTIAERMFRHNPSALLYAPLRTVIVEGADGVTRLSMDQPSAQFRSLGDPRITEVGIELDRKVAALLRHLAVPVPDVLTGD